jgi:hypothetical protein
MTERMEGHHLAGNFTFWCGGIIAPEEDDDEEECHCCGRMALCYRLSNLRDLEAETKHGAGTLCCRACLEHCDFGYIEDGISLEQAFKDSGIEEE